MFHTTLNTPLSDPMISIHLYQAFMHNTSRIEFLLVPKARTLYIHNAMLLLLCLIRVVCLYAQTRHSYTQKFFHVLIFASTAVCSRIEHLTTH